MSIVSTQWREESKQAQKLHTERMQEGGGGFQLSRKSYERATCTAQPYSANVRNLLQVPLQKSEI